ncbi:MAG: ribonuclease P protein component [Candidatus Omnitrophica bacterium]|nr:ribonuclease P protein component [Candidatus Omnitrophota bacterium]MBU1933265.1 ribonuclease P protein component [Candidatus Omnitrophota bacterium]
MDSRVLHDRERLKKNSDISRVFDKGIRLKGRLVSVFILRDASSHTNRAAFIIKKSLYDKKTVLRNRFRRVIREAYRNSKFLLFPGHDIVILSGCLDKNTSSATVEKDLRHVFKQYIEKYHQILS